MTTIFLDGKKMITESELHSEISSSLDFPEHYGKNLDALWDCLTGWIDLPVEIIWRDFSFSKEHLGDYAEKAFSVFEGASEELEELSIKKQ